jgi:hypothetical protein
VLVNERLELFGHTLLCAFDLAQALKILIPESGVFGLEGDEIPVVPDPDKRQISMSIRIGYGSCMSFRISVSSCAAAW